ILCRIERRRSRRCDGDLARHAETAVEPRPCVAVSRAERVTPEQRRRAHELFEAALEHEPADVVRWLAAAAGDAEVRGEVQALLDHHARAGSFLTQPLAEAAPHLLDEDRTLESGTVLGSYTVARELGRGGMGRVYLAKDS